MLLNEFWLKIIFYIYSTPSLTLSSSFSSKVAAIIVYEFKIKNSDKYCSEVGSQLTIFLNDPFCDFDLKGLLFVLC